MAAATLKMKYDEQKNRARRRGIEWHFTYESWLAWWGDDIVKRGTSKDSLVMARTGDIGPYHPDNVRKATVSENVNESNQRKWQPIKTKDGEFPNIQACATFYGKDRETITKAMKRKNSKYGFIKENI